MTIRLVIAIAVGFDWPMEQADVNTAFLNAELDIPMCIQQPEGHEDPDHPSWVCQLEKGLYGLKQAATLWFKRLAEYLRSLEFHQLYTDATIFVRTDSDGPLCMIAFYVDDLIIAAREPTFISHVKD